MELGSLLGLSALSHPALRLAHSAAADVLPAETLAESHTELLRLVGADYWAAMGSIKPALTVRRAIYFAATRVCMRSPALLEAGGTTALGSMLKALGDTDAGCMVALFDMTTACARGAPAAPLAVWLGLTRHGHSTARCMAAAARSQRLVTAAGESARRPARRRCPCVRCSDPSAAGAAGQCDRWCSSGAAGGGAVGGGPRGCG
jgi:hypothetical protein